MDLVFNAEAQRRRDAERFHNECIENMLSEKIIDAAIEVHRILGGPGLLESLYEEALVHELRLRGLFVESQVLVPVVYKNQTLKSPMRIDLIVERTIVVEVKATEDKHSLHAAQLLTYLRLTGLRLGLVLNFGQRLLIDGITRVVNRL